MVSCFDSAGFDGTMGASVFDVCAVAATVQEAIGSGGVKYKLSYKQRSKLRFRTTATAQLQHLLEERQRGRAFIQFTLAEQTKGLFGVKHNIKLANRAITSPIHKLNISKLQSIFVKHELKEKRKITPEFYNIRYILWKLKQKLEEL